MFATVGGWLVLSIVIPMSPTPEVGLQRKRRRDFIPDDVTFRCIDEHSMKAPSLAKEDLAELAEYLTATTKSTFEQVRAFYVWITHNINYDTSGYFGRAPLQHTDPYSVLKTRLTVCEGYCRLFEAFCRQVNIPVKTISGYAKAFGYIPGDDVTYDIHNAHAWNAVFLGADWFLLDVTWGAGFVKAKEKKYVAKFNNAYFLTDPVVFLTDHFPSPVKGYEHCESEDEWQLTEYKLSKAEFCKIVSFDKHGKEWGIEAITHNQTIIYNAEYEVDIILQATFVEMSDYVAFMYQDNRKLDQFTYTHMLTEKRVNIHICMPAVGVFSVQIFGRRKNDNASADYQPIIKYILQCTKANDSPIPYPAHHTVYGPVANLNKYGVGEVGATVQDADEGEIHLIVKPTRYIDILPKLHFVDHSIDLKQYCFVDYSECFEFINILLRLPFVGYYKLELLSIPEQHSKQYSTFVTHLIKSSKACTDGIFPDSNEHALKYKCCIIAPLLKHLPPNSDVFVCIKSPLVNAIRCNKSQLLKLGDDTFEGTIETPGDECKLSLEGCAQDGVFHTLYTYIVEPPL